jgi:hypothetical protein
MMNAKPIYWITLTRWMSLTLEEHGELDRFVSKRGCELGIDVAGFHTNECDEFQKDRDEYIEEMSLGGRPYKVRR